MGAGPVIAILMLFVVHVGAFVLLFWHLAGSEMRGIFRLGSSDDDGGSPPPSPPRAPSDGSGGGLPLPGAVPASVRLREPGRISDGHPRPERRPSHPPEREPVRSPASRS